ncbi:MAG: aminotransferase class V-fold PLP-dependent enzyme [Bacteroidetes bacterium]|nr:aminotransferase class V-fold PLP-dependent enzyme [Bacteroidota bacterium]
MKRKHFLTIGAGLSIGSLLGKSALNIDGKSLSVETIDPITGYNDVSKKWPVSLESGVNDGEDSAYWDFVRSLFPLNSSLTFLNNGTMGITPYPVLEAVNKSFHNIAENAAYPTHDGSIEDMLASIIGCKGTEIAITKNVSEGVNHACWGIALEKGDEVIISKHEHVGGCLPWIYRSKTEGIVLKVVELGATAQETLNNIKSMASKKTKVLALPHIPCTIGQILPVREICEWARGRGILTAIDGAHPLGMIQFNVKEMGCDYYSGCFHKWMLGPIGTGFFYVSESMLSKTRITHIAAYSTDKFDMSTQAPSMGELVAKTSRYCYGTFSGPLFDGVMAAMKFYLKIGPEAIEKRVKGLSASIQHKLMAINDASPAPSNPNSNLPLLHRMPNTVGPIIEILTPTEDISRAGQVGFRIHRKIAKSSARFVDFARKKQIILRYVGENNIDCVRVSTHYYNNQKDINTLFVVLEEFLTTED